MDQRIRRRNALWPQGCPVPGDQIQSGDGGMFLPLSETVEDIEDISNDLGCNSIDIWNLRLELRPGLWISCDI